MVANDSNVAAMAAYTNNMTQGNLQASMWGQNIDLASMPEWTHSFVLENVMYARTLFAENPDVLGADGKVDMSAGGNPIKFPQDITAALSASSSNTSASSSGSAGSAASTGSATSASASGSPSATGTSGAGRTLASGAIVGAAVVVASFLAL